MFIFFIFKQVSLFFYSYFIDLINIEYSIYSNIIPFYLINKTRDSKGKFKSINKTEPIIPLNKSVLDPLIGNLLGDGSLLFNKKV